MTDFIIAQIDYAGRPYLAAALYTQGRRNEEAAMQQPAARARAGGLHPPCAIGDMTLTELCVRPREEGSLVDEIYVGCLDKAVRNIGGAFVRFRGEEVCFLPGWKSSQPSGHILLQIARDAVDHKHPTARSALSIAGRLAVIKSGQGLALSAKLSDEEKALLRKWTEGLDMPGCQVLLRTNAVKASKAEVLAEIARLYARWQKLHADAAKASPGTCLYRPAPFYIEMLQNLYVLPDRVFTDVPAIAQRLLAEPALIGEGRQEEDLLVKNKSLTLAQLYSLPHELDRLMGKIVWLPCGGYLVIERTEAFISVDVNTGKCARGRIPEETYRRINLEAAPEILRQVRLRNLSGMLLIDFINLENEDHREELVNVMRKLARREHTPVEIVDLTPLGIMECVRVRARQPLSDVLGG